MDSPTDDPCNLAGGAVMRGGAYNSAIFFGRSGYCDAGDNGDHRRCASGWQRQFMR
ncbi:MAG: hypothetical protein KAX78_07725 [Phycisphaerae bacterium]|nr:hypothetical protein [Phycisphaerae bacterium]